VKLDSHDSLAITLSDVMEDICSSEIDSVEEASDTVDACLSPGSLEELEIESKQEREPKPFQEPAPCDSCGQVPYDWDSFG
jgi:hypothetical protein